MKRGVRSDPDYREHQGSAAKLTLGICEEAGYPKSKDLDGGATKILLDSNRATTIATQVLDTPWPLRQCSVEDADIMFQD